MKKSLAPISSRFLTLLFMLFLSVGTCDAAQVSPQTTVSLLTSGPSNKAIFTAWGHTAIRVKDPLLGKDHVYNYGIFHFGSDFIPRFVSGKTDYRLGVSSMLYTFEEVEYKNCDLIEQELNLTMSEKEQLVEALEENYKPENRYYRYKFFGDNCATRPRQIIAQNINGTVTYPSTGNDSTTYRNCIYELLKSSQWFVLGIDLCLGTETDKVMTDQERMFLPAELCIAYNGAKIEKQDTVMPLVKETRLLYEKKESADTEEGTSLPDPSLVFPILMILIVAHTIFYTYTQKDDRWFHLLFFIAAGLMGTLITFVSWVSVHEFTFPNWNVVLINPLQLVLACLIYTKKAQIRKYLYTIILVLSVIFILLNLTDITGQQYNAATLPIAISQGLLCWEYLMKERAKRHVKC